LSVSNGSFTIAGRVTDGVNGIGGVLIDANTTNGPVVATFTDTNGNYALGVSPNKWRLRPEKSGLARAGYVAFQSRSNLTVTSSSLSNIDFQISKATAMIYGSIRDNHANPVIGVEVSA